ncbi:MAG: hypothetical protein V2A78_07160 [bacterium]
MKNSVLKAAACIIILVSFLSLPAWGQDAGNKNSVINYGEHFSDSRLLVGQKVVFSGLAERDLTVISGDTDIQGTVSGDLTVVGGKVKIRGHVKGSLLVIGGTVSLEGPVDGATWIMAGGLDFSGKVQRSLKAACITLAATQASAVGRDLMFIAVGSHIGGRVGESVRALATNIDFSSLVGGNVDLMALGDITMEPQADVHGNFHYKSPQPFNRKEGSSIAGKVDYEILAMPKDDEELEKQIKQAFKNAVLFVKVFSVIALLLSALLLALFFPGLAEKVSGHIIKKPLWAFLQGLLFYILFPVACLILLISVFGIPLALSAGLLYLGVLYLAQVFTGIAIGECFLRLGRFRGDEELLPPSRGKVFLAALLGSIFLAVLIVLPHGIGFGISMLSCFWGLGGMIGAGARLCR